MTRQLCGSLLAQERTHTADWRVPQGRNSRTPSRSPHACVDLILLYCCTPREELNQMLYCITNKRTDRHKKCSVIKQARRQNNPAPENTLSKTSLPSQTSLAAMWKEPSNANEPPIITQRLRQAHPVIHPSPVGDARVTLLIPAPSHPTTPRITAGQEAT